MSGNMHSWDDFIHEAKPVFFGFLSVFGVFVGLFVFAASIVGLFRLWGWLFL